MKVLHNSNNKKLIFPSVVLLIAIIVYFLLGVTTDKHQPIQQDNQSVSWRGEQSLNPPTSDGIPSVIVPSISNLTFTANSTTQLVNLYNPDKNIRYFKMQLFIDDELLWESGYVAPGDGYYSIDLAHPLQSGNYIGYLKINFFTDVGAKLPSSAKIKINVNVIEKE